MFIELDKLKVDLDDMNTMQPKVVAYKEINKRKLRLYIFEPSTKPKTCVICIHGGGWKRESPDRLFPHAAYFAKNGALAVCVEYRLIDEKLDVRDCLSDCADALDYLRDKYKNISFIAFGDSAGAYLANCLGCTKILLNLSRRSKRVDFVVDLNGIVDLTGKWSYAISDQSLKENDKREIEIKYSPIYNVSPTDAMVLLVHGQMDNIVDIKDSQDYSSELTKNGIENELWILPEAQHAFILFDYMHDNVFVADVLKKIVNFIRQKKLL